MDIKDGYQRWISKMDIKARVMLRAFGTFSGKDKEIIGRNLSTSHEIWLKICCQ